MSLVSIFLRGGQFSGTYHAVWSLLLAVGLSEAVSVAFDDNTTTRVLQNSAGMMRREIANATSNMSDLPHLDVSALAERLGHHPHPHVRRKYHEEWLPWTANGFPDQSFKELQCNKSQYIVRIDIRCGGFLNRFREAECSDGAVLKVEEGDWGGYAHSIFWPNGERTLNVYQGEQVINRFDECGFNTGRKHPLHCPPGTLIAGLGIRYRKYPESINAFCQTASPFHHRIELGLHDSAHLAHESHEAMYNAEHAGEEIAKTQTDLYIVNAEVRHIAQESDFAEVEGHKAATKGAEAEAKVLNAKARANAADAEAQFVEHESGIVARYLKKTLADVHEVDEFAKHSQEHAEEIAEKASADLQHTKDMTHANRIFIDHAQHNALEANAEAGRTFLEATTTLQESNKLNGEVGHFEGESGKAQAYAQQTVAGSHRDLAQAEKAAVDADKDLQYVAAQGIKAYHDLQYTKIEAQHAMTLEAKEKEDENLALGNRGKTMGASYSAQQSDEEVKKEFHKIMSGQHQQQLVEELALHSGHEADLAVHALFNHGGIIQNAEDIYNKAKVADGRGFVAQSTANLSTYMMRKVLQAALQDESDAKLYMGQANDAQKEIAHYAKQLGVFQKRGIAERPHVAHGLDEVHSALDNAAKVASGATKDGVLFGELRHMSHIDQRLARKALTEAKAVLRRSDGNGERATKTLHSAYRGLKSAQRSKSATDHALRQANVARQLADSEVLKVKDARAKAKAALGNTMDASERNERTLAAANKASWAADHALGQTRESLSEIRFYARELMDASEEAKEYIDKTKQAQQNSAVTYNDVNMARHIVMQTMRHSQEAEAEGKRANTVVLTALGNQKGYSNRQEAAQAVTDALQGIEEGKMASATADNVIKDTKLAHEDSAEARSEAKDAIGFAKSSRNLTSQAAQESRAALDEAKKAGVEAGEAIKETASLANEVSNIAKANTEVMNETAKVEHLLQFLGAQSDMNEGVMESLNKTNMHMDQTIKGLESVKNTQDRIINTLKKHDDSTEKIVATIAKHEISLEKFSAASSANFDVAQQSLQSLRHQDSALKKTVASLKSAQLTTDMTQQNQARMQKELEKITSKLDLTAHLQKQYAIKAEGSIDTLKNLAHSASTNGALTEKAASYIKKLTVEQAKKLKAVDSNANLLTFVVDDLHGQQDDDKRVLGNIHQTMQVDIQMQQSNGVMAAQQEGILAGVKKAMAQGSKTMETVQKTMESQDETLQALKGQVDVSKTALATTVNSTSMLSKALEASTRTVNLQKDTLRQQVLGNQKMKGVVAALGLTQHSDEALLNQAIQGDKLDRQMEGSVEHALFGLKSHLGPEYDELMQEGKLLDTLNWEEQNNNAGAHSLAAQIKETLEGQSSAIDQLIHNVHTAVTRVLLQSRITTGRLKNITKQMHHVVSYGEKVAAKVGQNAKNLTKLKDSRVETSEQIEKTHSMLTLMEQMERDLVVDIVNLEHSAKKVGNKEMKTNMALRDEIEAQKKLRKMVEAVEEMEKSEHQEIDLENPHAEMKPGDYIKGQKMGCNFGALRKSAEFAAAELKALKEELIRTGKQEKKDSASEAKEAKLLNEREHGMSKRIDELADARDHLQETDDEGFEHISDTRRLVNLAAGEVKRANHDLKVLDHRSAMEAYKLTHMHKMINNSEAAVGGLDGTLAKFAVAQKHSQKALAQERFVEQEAIDEMKGLGGMGQREEVYRGKLSDSLGHVKEDEQAVEKKESEVRGAFQKVQKIEMQKLSAASHPGTSTEGAQAQAEMHSVNRTAQQEGEQTSHIQSQIDDQTSELSSINGSTEITAEMRNTMERHDEEIEKDEEQIEENTTKSKRTFIILYGVTAAVVLLCCGIDNVWRMKIAKMEKEVHS
eukprot:gnl/MRDRNA2_/MRDRNA2_93481_c0_seq1.p1 gnl/MRDRNA2_/MRDRNA2_93481_c0~~gnl/MRDRNA2_/MRDRNA2_93481_c0_seq1.p1  ORF type:complete len:1878 (-),score=511.71 gnl/MRDRNA2_/MRDRNA2_93481_c0_seq1:11-5644(-)